MALSIGYPQNHPKLIVDSSFPSKTCHFMGPGPPIRPCWNSRGQVNRVVRACVELGYRARSAGGRTYLLESRSVHRGWGVSIPLRQSIGNPLEMGLSIGKSPMNSVFSSQPCLITGGYP